ncbi:MAG: ABC transporter substrate-binding protein [Oscillospiraceae bacterium]|nr:ABC transporter substrate-binding protein [Oscillospiraceae bacterium]
MKKICIFIVVLAVFAGFISCSQNTDDKEQKSGATEAEDLKTGEEDEDYLAAIRPDIPGTDFGGYEFRILTNDNCTHAIPLHTRDIIAEQETGEPINDAVYKRNAEIEEKFNIKIKNIALGTDYTPSNTLKNAVSAGDDAYDLMVAYAPGAAQSAAAGHLLNWNTLPYIDMSKPWWFQSAVTNLSVGNKIFLSLSDLSISTMHYVYMVYFNKELQKDFNVENLYELVRSGKWTFDKISEVAKGITLDLNGDGIMNDDDRYGAIISYAALNFFYAGGNTLTQKDENNYPYLDIATPRAINTFEKAYDICHADYVRFAPEWINENEMRDMFKSGQAFLYFHSLSKIDSLRDMETDFGVLPYPKLDETQQKYSSYIDLHNPLMGVPVTVNELERIGAVIEDLSYLSRKYLVPAYYDTTLKTKFARDEDSVEMLDIIRDGVVFDFGCVYDVSTAFVFQTQINANKRDFVSAIEKITNSAQKNLDKVIKAYDEAEG